MCRQHSHCLSVARATYCTQLHCHPCVVTAGQEVHPQQHCHELWRDVSPDENRMSTMPLGNILAPPEPHGSPTIGAAHRSPSTATRQVGETPGYSLRPHPSGPPFSAVSTPGQGRVGEGELGGARLLSSPCSSFHTPAPQHPGAAAATTVVQDPALGSLLRKSGILLTSWSSAVGTPATSRLLFVS